MSLLRVSILVFLCLGIYLQSKSQTPCFFHDLKKEITPLGKTLDYRQVNDSVYHIYYGKANDLVKLDGDFNCNGAPVTRPTFHFENEDFLFLSRGCGSACRYGMLLPLDSNKHVKSFYNWNKVDLNEGVIITLGWDDGVTLNLFYIDDYSEEHIQTSVQCDALILGYCIDSIEIRDKQLRLTWFEKLKAKDFVYNLKQ